MRALPRLLLALWAFAALETAVAPAVDASLLGLTRAEVEAVLGRPNSALRRGDSEVLIFGEGARVELRDGRVAAIRGGSFGEIVAADGTRYIVDQEGAARSAAAAADFATEEVKETGTIEAARAVAAPAEVAAPPEQAAVVDEDLALIHAAEHPEEVVMAAHPEVGRLLAAQQQTTLAAERQAAPQAGKTSVWFEWAIGAGLHLAIVIAVLSLSLKWLGLPFVWADLVKVGVLTLVVRETIYALGGLGGNWEMLRLFRVGECASFIVLAVLLFRFKVALSGLTALKVAAATKLVSYLLMIGVGLALSFAL
ncbi:MAG: hypothetical protein ACREIA_11030 [Opitutaceae bacterium]